MKSSVTKAQLIRVTDGKPGEPADDAVAVEEPLSIQLADDPFAVTMRTPGHDQELTLGLLLSEGIISSALDVSGAPHCGRPGSEGYGNTVNVRPTSGGFQYSPEQRAYTMTSACGVCGRQTIDDLLDSIGPTQCSQTVAPSVISSVMAALSDRQPTFRATGGLHAAGLATLDGKLIVVREDVGRHNAVDKVFGRQLIDQALPCSDRILVVSARASFDIVQKAARSGTPIVVCASAPTSLAIETAKAFNITLIGFARSKSFNIYAHSQRIR